MSKRQEFCAVFSSGNYCYKGGECPYIHNWPLFYAARKEATLDKKNGEASNAGLVQKQDGKRIQTVSANDNKHPHPHVVSDAQLTDQQLPGPQSYSQTRHMQMAFNVVNHAQTAKDMDASNLNISATKLPSKDLDTSRLSISQTELSSKHSKDMDTPKSSISPTELSSKGSKNVGTSKLSVSPTKLSSKAMCNPKPAISLANVSSKGAETSKLSTPSTSLSSGYYRNEVSAEGEPLQSLAWRPKVVDGQLRNVATASTDASTDASTNASTNASTDTPTNNSRQRSRWPKQGGLRRRHLPGRIPAGEDEDQKTCDDLLGQVIGSSAIKPLVCGQEAGSSATNPPICDQEVSKYRLSESRAAEVFTLFGELPFELRAVIWEFALRSTPYNPRIRLEPVHDNEGHLLYHRIICRSLTPTLMRVCQESRTEALKFYSLILGETTYINKSAGTLYLDSGRKGVFRDFTESALQPELQDIKHLAVKLTEWSGAGFQFQEAIKEYTNLKTLVLMAEDIDDCFFANKSAIKLVRNHLCLKKHKHGGPVIIIVPSGMVETFLSREIM